jgi:hypothetical protein
VHSGGRVAVARAAEYRVEWFAGPGKLLAAGEVQRVELIRIDAAERDSFRAARASAPVGGARVGGAPPGDANVVRDSRNLYPDAVFPPYKPAVDGSGAAIMSPGGELWVRRSRRAGDNIMRYDVFDQRGVVQARVTLPRGRTLLAFGATSVYMIRTDENDLQWIERYALP